MDRKERGMRKHAAPAVIVVAALTVMLGPAAVAQDEWKHGIGTGFFGLNIDGDGGFTLRALDVPIYVDMTMNNSEVRDLVNSAFGLGGSSAKGKWTLTYSVGQMELGDKVKGTTADDDPASLKVDFTATGAEFAAAYRFALTGKNAWSVLGGVRYTGHEYDFKIEIDNDPPNPPLALKRNIDEGWTDVLVGLTHGTSLSDKWTWGTRLDAGFGGSEGTYNFNTSLNWHFAKSWVLVTYGKYTSIEFENDDPGDPDWYFYDADEFGLGFNFVYTY
jgi:hypothetical protein